MDRARDLFYFACFTGLKYSDIAQIIPNEIEETILKIRVQKTRQILTVPLLPQAKRMLVKYDNDLPALSNQKLNKHLKELGKLSDIDEEIVTLQTNNMTIGFQSFIILSVLT